LEASLQVYAAKYIAIANTALKNGITIPTILGITLTDIDITNTAGLLSFGGSLVPPTFFWELAELMQIWQMLVKDSEESQVDPI